ncbi:MAG: NUDIX domain-containing protein [Candidatus Aenigmarchaeota archaeon]|nr:NUDIX domain-containing protein [Candidatus Aenigmarchaeota archaeon]
MPLRKNGCIEGVTFAFVRKGKILAEIRNRRNRSEIMIPSGIIEKSDAKNGDYRIAALKREIREEMNVDAEEFVYLGKCRLRTRPLVMHVFLIKKWKGEIPSHTVENGKKDSRLVWFPLDERYFVRYGSNFTCRKVLEYLKAGSSSKK